MNDVQGGFAHLRSLLFEVRCVPSVLSGVVAVFFGHVFRLVTPVRFSSDL
jgi:hypothetical protein